MKEVTSTLITEAVFSDDGIKRYVLRKTWNVTKPKLTIIMLAPSQASDVSMDTTTQLVVNNVCRLGYGGVTIVNLFAKLNDFALKEAEAEDPENLEAIIEAVKNCEKAVYAAGTGKLKNKVFQKRQEQVMTAIRPYEDKLHCLCNAAGGGRLQHPLSPVVREWHLSPLKISELIEEKPLEAKQPDEKGQETRQSEKKPRGRPAKNAAKTK